MGKHGKKDESDFFSDNEINALSSEDDTTNETYRSEDSDNLSEDGISEIVGDDYESETFLDDLSEDLSEDYSETELFSEIDTDDYVENLLNSFSAPSESSSSDRIIEHQNTSSSTLDSTVIMTPQETKKASKDRVKNINKKAASEDRGSDKKELKKNSVEVVEDDRPLWEKNPEKYRKKKPLFVRMLGGLWAFIFFWILTGGIFAVLGIGLGVTLIYSFSDPELDAKFANLDIDYTSQILATKSSGEIVVYEELYSTANRVWVSINDMPQDLLDAVVASEDKRFFEHNGVDFITTGKATIGFVMRKLLGQSGVGAGGSTLTQQLIKVITGENEVSGLAGVQRKFKEILRAFYIERKYNKNQILEYYLNTVNFGYQYDGIYTAAKSYFGKEPKNLTLAECATIIAVTNYPAYFNPYESLENNRTRRLWILSEMYDQGKISENEYVKAKSEEIKLIGKSTVTTKTSSSVTSYFTDLVFEWLVNELMVQKGYTRNYAINYIYTSGLRIYTTVDPDIQQYCEEYFSDERNYYTKESDYIASQTSEDPKQEVGFLLEDPKNGNVLAIIGGRGQKTESLGLNRVTMSKRQPGSSIKPLTVYGQAIERNLITAGTVIDDSPLYIKVDPKAAYKDYKNIGISDMYDLSVLKYTSYTGWPSNYDSKYRGSIDVKIALSNSYNAPSAKVVQLVGIEDSYNFAKNMLGLTSLVDQDKDVAPLCVGALTYGVTVQEMVSAYTVFANAGIYSASRCVTRVETYDGKIVLENDVDRSIVFTPQTAYIITDILIRAVNNSSTSDVADLYDSEAGMLVETAGKSGTTSSFNDRWFIGYTPHYLAGIWWGFDKNYYGTTENTEHIRMWHDIMEYVHRSRGITEAEFSKPDGLVSCSYCSISGKLPGPYCSSDPSGKSTVKTGIFKSGTQPTETCDVHHQLYVCDESGQIACEYCPSAHLATFRDIMRSYPYTYIKTYDSEYICPPLTSTQLLYCSSTLPVYTYMVPEGEYPTIPEESKSKYKNCVCSVHGVQGSHYYTHKFSYSGNTDSEIYEDATVPAAILTPKELSDITKHATDLELSYQIYDITEGAYFLEGTSLAELFPDQYNEDGTLKEDSFIQ